MPCAEPVCRIEWIWNVLFSRIRFATARVTTIVSSAGTRPEPSLRGISRCEITARNDSESIVRTWSC